MVGHMLDSARLQPAARPSKPSASTLLKVTHPAQAPQVQTQMRPPWHLRQQLSRPAPSSPLQVPQSRPPIIPAPRPKPCHQPPRILVSKLTRSWTRRPARLALEPTGPPGPKMQTLGLCRQQLRRRVQIPAQPRGQRPLHRPSPRAQRQPAAQEQLGQMRMKLPWQLQQQPSTRPPHAPQMLLWWGSGALLPWEPRTPRGIPRRAPLQRHRLSSCWDPRARLQPQLRAGQRQRMQTHGPWRQLPRCNRPEQCPSLQTALQSPRRLRRAAQLLPLLEVVLGARTRLCCSR